MSDFNQSPFQLGFDALLDDAHAENKALAFEREAGHLPATMEEGFEYFRGLIARNHEAMLSVDAEAVRALHEEAHLLAQKLNDGEPGILAGPDAPGNVLAANKAAREGEVPRWGARRRIHHQATGHTL